MKRGKQTCRILKEIRRQIAEANDIEYITSECHYQGECSGTCPKCEAEVHYLEQQIERRRTAGKAIALLGLSTSIMAMNAQTAKEMPASPDTLQTVSEFTIYQLDGKPEVTRGVKDTTVFQVDKIKKEAPDLFLITGTVVDSTNEPLIGAIVSEKNTNYSTLTDTIGNFSLRFSGKYPLIVQYIGYKTQEINADKNNKTSLQIVLQQSEEMLMGEVMVTSCPNGIPPKPQVNNEEVWEGMVERMPEFPGGNKALLEFLRKNICYPAKMKKENITGRVIVQFTINKNGKITHPKIARSLHPVFDKEVLRVIKLMPAWKPGTISGKPAKFGYTIPVTFALPSTMKNFL